MANDHETTTVTEGVGWTAGWWEGAFVRTRNASEIAGHARGSRAMLAVIAYDITEAKRLRQVADCCKDFGVRVQYSVFECRLEAHLLDEFWQRLCEIADPKEDRLVIYPIHGMAQRAIRTFGKMSCSEVVVSYMY